MAGGAPQGSKASAAAEPMTPAPACNDDASHTAPVWPAPGNGTHTAATKCSAAGGAPSVSRSESTPDPGGASDDERPRPVEDGAGVHRNMTDRLNTSKAGSTSMLEGSGALPHGAAPMSVEEPDAVQALVSRALAMFTGPGEAPRASGMPAMSANVTNALCIHVSAAVKSMMGEPKKPGPHRDEMIDTCGQLDKEEARGWLLNDALGRPILHRNDQRQQNSAREVGKRVAHAATAAEAAIKAAKAKAATAKSKAKRAAALDPSKRVLVAAAMAAGDAAVAAVLAEQIELELPAVTVGAARPERYWAQRNFDEATARHASACARTTRARTEVTVCTAEWQAATRRARKVLARCQEFTVLDAEWDAEFAKLHAASEAQDKAEAELRAAMAQVDSAEAAAAQAFASVKCAAQEIVNDLHERVVCCHAPPGWNAEEIRRAIYTPLSEEELNEM
jgi:hypothetical protein